MKTLRLRDIAEQNELSYIETTPERNGYPSRIKGAIIGFDTFEQAESLAVEHGLRIEVFTKKDGWQLWHRTGNWANEAFTMSTDMFGDNYTEFSSDVSEDDFFDTEIQPFISDFNNFDEVELFLNWKKEIFEEIEKASEDEIVITKYGYYYNTVKTKLMQYYYDTNHFAIGLID